jgi:hypothetical protein
VGTATLILLTLGALGSQPQGMAAEDTVDVIEINHFVNDSGQVQLDQVIFYDWSPSQSRYIVRAWRSLKTPSQLPMKLPNGTYQAIWHDSRDGNVMRKVTAKSVVETWTTYDPETVNQEFLDRNLRRELTQRKPAKNTTARSRPSPTTPRPTNAAPTQTAANR